MHIFHIYKHFVIQQIEVYETRSIEMLSGTAMVHIFIVDSNDNPPVFEFDRYNVSITEEQSSGAFVTNITVCSNVFYKIADIKCPENTTHMSTQKLA